MLESAVERRVSAEALIVALFGDLGEGLEPLVESLGTTGFARLVSSVEHVTVESGEVVYREGDLANTQYLMTSGRLQLTSKRGGEWVLSGAQDLDPFHRQSLHYERTAVALDRSELLQLGREAWLELIADFPVLGIRYLARRLRKLRGVFSVLRGELLVPPLSAWRELGDERPEVREDLRSQWRDAPEPGAARSRERMDRIERALTLMAVPSLRDVGVQPLLDLAAATEELRLGEGEGLPAPGRYTSFVVVKGELLAQAPDGAGQRFRFRPGAILHRTEVAMIPPEFAVHATQPTLILAFGFEDWMAKLSAYPGFLLGLMDSTGRVVEQALNIIGPRLASLQSAPTGPGR